MTLQLRGSKLFVVGIFPNRLRFLTGSFPIVRSNCCTTVGALKVNCLFESKSVLSASRPVNHSWNKKLVRGKLQALKIVFNEQADGFSSHRLSADCCCS